MEKVEAVIVAMRHERYRFSPVRRVYVPKKTGKLAPSRLAVVVGQAGRRSGPPSSGGVLRAAVLRPLARVPPRPRLSHRPAGDSQRLDRDDVVHRRGHSLTASARLTIEVMLSILSEKIQDGRFLRLIEHAFSRVLGGLAMERHAERRTAGRGCFTRPFQYLPAQVGQVRRDSSYPAIYPGEAQENRTLRTTRRKGGGEGPQPTTTGPRSWRATPAAPPPSCRWWCDPGYRRLRYSRYADLSRDLGISRRRRLMPRTGLCRGHAGKPVNWRGSWREARHNQRPCKNARSGSLALYRPGAVRGGVVRASARSLMAMSAWT